MAGHAHAHAHSHDAHGHHHDHGHPHVHVTPLSTYLIVFALLMVMTALTVAVAYIDVGPLNTVIALSIASFKATIVILYFMHVKHASRLTKLLVVTGLFFLAILLGETMIDYATRMWVNPPALLE
jgi:cytochrome c oxidase subunit IV